MTSLWNINNNRRRTHTKARIHCIVNDGSIGCGWFSLLMHSVAEFPETEMIINDQQKSGRIIQIIIIESGWTIKSH